MFEVMTVFLMMPTILLVMIYWKLCEMTDADRAYREWLYVRELDINTPPPK